MASPLAHLKILSITHRNTFVKTFLSSMVFALACVACAGNLHASNPLQPETSHAKPVTDYANLIGRLRAAGATVKTEGKVEQPFFFITGRALKVYSDDVQVFQYAHTAAMEAQAAQISADGSTVGTAKPFWVDAPHFYKSGKLLVLYVGGNAKVLQALESVLGKQFAGK